MPPLVADGAMGTELLARTGHIGSPAELNLSAPDLVRALHREYLRAGARLLVANTLGGTPEQAVAGIRLAREAAASQARGKREEAREIPILRFAQNDMRGDVRNDLLRDAQDDMGRDTRSAILVAGSLAGEPVPSSDPIQALSDADLLWVETVTSLAALDAALEGIRRFTDKPVCSTLSFAVEGTLDGLQPAEVAHRLQGFGLAAIGYGCGFGLGASRPVLAELRQAAPDALLIAKPNLGLPRDGRYDVTPQQAASWAVDMAELGIQIIGLCCGSTPAHVRAMADFLSAGC